MKQALISDLYKMNYIPPPVTSEADVDVALRELNGFLGTLTRAERDWERAHADVLAEIGKCLKGVEAAKKRREALNARLEEALSHASESGALPTAGRRDHHGSESVGPRPSALIPHCGLKRRVGCGGLRERRRSRPRAVVHVGQVRQERRIAWPPPLADGGLAPSLRQAVARPVRGLAGIGHGEPRRGE